MSFINRYMWEEMVLQGGNWSTGWWVVGLLGRLDRWQGVAGERG